MWLLNLLIACDTSCYTCSAAGPSGCTSCKAQNKLSAIAPSSCISCGTGYYHDTDGNSATTCSSNIRFIFNLLNLTNSL